MSSSLIWRRSKSCRVASETVRTEHFTALFEAPTDEPLARVAVGRLEAAYRRVGKTLGVYPPQPITVVLYTREQFGDITKLAAWSVAVYDGRIRVPIGGALEQRDELDRVLSHEFVHAVVAMFGGRTVPAWMNEGLATVLEPAGSEDAEAALARIDIPPPLSTLHRSFVGLSRSHNSKQSSCRRSRFPALRFPHWAAVRWCAAVLYVAALAAYTAAYGIPVQRELVISWTCGALAVASIGRPPREILQLVLDWAPIVAVLAVYDFTRGAADSLGIGVHAHADDRLRPVRLLRRDADRMAPGAPLRPRAPSTGGTSPSRSSTPPTSSSRSRSPASSGSATGSPSSASPSAWSRSRSPASPPTSSSRRRRPGWRPKWACSTTSTGPPSKGWEVLGVGTAGALLRRARPSVNLVAAVPSLHSAFTRAGRDVPLGPGAPAGAAAAAGCSTRWRWALTLIATGEHYFFDVLLGWLYAGAAMTGWARWERRKERRAEAAPVTVHPGLCQSRLKRVDRPSGSGSSLIGGGELERDSDRPRHPALKKKLRRFASPAVSLRTTSARVGGDRLGRGFEAAAQARNVRSTS